MDIRRSKFDGRTFQSSLFCDFFPRNTWVLTPRSLQEAVFSVKASCADGYYGTAKVTVQVLVGKSAVWTVDPVDPVDSRSSSDQR